MTAWHISLVISGSMHGVFVSNSYLKGRKFEEPWEMMSDAAARAGVRLERLHNSDLALPLADHESVSRKAGDPDFFLFWDKDVACASNLELCGYRVFNTSECVRVCDDKALTHLILARSGVRSVTTIVCPMSFDDSDDPSFAETAASAIGTPMVLKDRFGSFGQQVRLVKDEAELASALSGRYVPRILQPFVECGGHDVRVEVVGGRAIAAMGRTAPPGDFRSNATIGGTVSPHVPDDEEAELAIRACEAVGADFAGVDILRTVDGPMVCEVNSNAHIKNLLECTGINAADAIMSHVIREVGGRRRAGCSTRGGTSNTTGSSQRDLWSRGGPSEWTPGSP